MLKIRVIPCLLLQNNGIVKTVKFKNPRYIGDPINVVRILNEKEVDELIFLDIEASKKNREPNFGVIEDIARECFMPFAYGGGITTISQAEKLFSLGVEKVIVGSHALENTTLIEDISQKYGAQSVVVSINVNVNLLGQRKLYNPSNGKNLKKSIIDFSKQVEFKGAGEIFLNSVAKDGTRTGYDFELIQLISKEVKIPVTVCGGAGSLTDFKLATQKYGASAVAAGSLFVYHGKRNAVLVNYPKYNTLTELFK